MYPFVYNSGVSVRRGANTFTGLYSSVDPNNDEEDDDDDDGVPGKQKASQNIPQHQQQRKKPHVVYSSGPKGTLSRMASLSSLALSPVVSRGRKRKKKLVVGGIALNDARRFEGVKRWCESFGEVRQIKRMPNGDLVVSFQSAEVADTVCRVRAKVFIQGVGSVQLSWITDNNRR